MGAYAMGAPWLRFGIDCGSGEAEQRLRDVWAQMVGKTRQRSAPPWAGMGHGFGGPGFGGPGFGGPPWARGMRGPKARRGDVRAAILSVLSDQPRNGYQVIQEIADRTAGSWRPSPGSVYPTISQLEDEGLIEGDDDRGRRTVRLSDEGRQYLDEHEDEVAAVWAPFTEGVTRDDTDGDPGVDFASLKPELGRVMNAVWQIITTGTDEQRRSAVGVLVEARRALYQILADHPGDLDDGVDDLGDRGDREEES